MIVKIIVKGLLNNADGTRNIFYAENTASETPPDIADVGAYIRTMWDDTLLGLISEAWKGVSVEVDSWQSTGAYWQFEAEDTLAPMQGENTGFPAPNQVALVVTARTHAKRVVPKKFIAGVAASLVPEGVLSSLLLSALGDFGDAWLHGFPNDTPTWLARTWTKSHTAVPMLFARVDPITGSQRRRKQGVGL